MLSITSAHNLRWVAEDASRGVMVQYKFYSGMYVCMNVIHFGILQAVITHRMNDRHEAAHDGQDCRQREPGLQLPEAVHHPVGGTAVLGLPGARGAGGRGESIVIYYLQFIITCITCHLIIIRV